MQAHLETAGDGEFLELHALDNRLRIRSGAIGRPCLVLHAAFDDAAAAGAQYQHLRDAWQARGFAECAPTAQIVEGSVADELWSDGRSPHPLLEALLRLDGAEALRSRPRRIALFRHGLQWQRDFDLERVAEFGLHAAVIVEGDVEVSGVFSQLTPRHPRHVLVGGDLRAASFGHGDSHMRVLGSVHVHHILYGEGNDGSLRIDGSAHGRAFIRADHDMHAAGGCHAPVCDWDSDENWSDCLDPALFEEGDEGPGAMLSQEAIRAFMRDGRDPFRPGARPVVRGLPGAPPLPAAAAVPSFAERLRACVEAGDTEAITRLIETWPERDEAWQQALTGRLFAPSTTPQQRARLKALQGHGPAS